MNQPRSSGVLLHPTSLPGPHGIGDLGQAAYQFVDFLVAARQSLWQILPLGPTSFGDSPYTSLSSYAGNPLLVGLEPLVEEGDLLPADLTPVPWQAMDRVDDGAVIEHKTRLLRQAGGRFMAHASTRRREELDAFCDQKRRWLDDYALFMALKGACHGAMWNTWPDDIVQRLPEALSQCRSALAGEIHWHEYVQFQFFRQWSRLRRYANERGIRIIGDLPIFVAPDSADAWAHREVFHMDRKGQLTVVAGVPPDYFSPTGQRWGNPLYRWEAIAADGYRWWIDRIQSALELVDIVRVDHFRGFQDCWEIPADEPTAVKGRWVQGPGDALFAALRRVLGDNLPILAEDLGMITEEVRSLRVRSRLPGMKVLQFAFGGGPKHAYLPHNYDPDCAVYLGTHDNDTTLGWFRSLGQREREDVLRYLGRGEHDIVWAMMHLAFMSVAQMAIVTVQDLLKLGGEARMNTPGAASGNWQWRYRPGALGDDIIRWLGELTDTFGRALPEGQT